MTVIALFDEANTTDIWTARLAMSKSRSADVRTLAAMVIADHEAVQHTARELARKLGVTATPPADDKSAVALAAAVATLQSKSGTEFDRACITQELAFHRSAIDVVTNTLLPNVELKALLKTVLEGSSTISPRLEPSPASSACIKLARHGRLAIA